MYDALLAMREGGSSPAVTATEAGSTSLTRDATTGKVVVQIDKLAAQGLAVVVTNAADGGTSTDKTLTVTIEESDVLGSGWATITTFPAISHGAAANRMVRRISSQKKYLRSVITAAGANGTISVDVQVHVGTSEMEES